MTCTLCGAPTHLGPHTSRGRICRTCSRRFPTGIRRILPKLSPYTLSRLLAYSDKHRDGFSCSAQYGALALDEKHGLLALSSHKLTEELPTDAIVISLLDVEDIGLESVRPRYAGGAVKVDVRFSCSIRGISIPISQIIAGGVRCRSTRIDSEHVRWEEQSVLSLFRNIILQSAELQQQGWLDRMAAFQTARGADEKRRAMDTLLLDDGYTEDELEQQKRRLAKTFHPDVAGVDDKYIKKILGAYEVLKGKQR